MFCAIVSTTVYQKKRQRAWSVATTSECSILSSYFSFLAAINPYYCIISCHETQESARFLSILATTEKKEKSATHHLPKPQAAHGYKLANDDYHEIYLYTHGTCNQSAFVRFTRNSFVAKTRLYIDNNHSERRMLVSALQVLDSMRCAWIKFLFLFRCCYCNEYVRVVRLLVNSCYRDKIMRTLINVWLLCRFD